MKAKRKKILLWGAVVVVVVGLPVGYYGAREVLKYRIRSWRKEGVAAAVAGDHARATELLVRYLQRRPGDVEALEHYIKSREQSELPNGQHLTETAGALKMLLGQEPDRVEARKHLLELLVRLGRGPEALDTANAILTQNDRKYAGDLRTLELKTEVLMRMRQDQAALETVGQWTAHAPADLKARMADVALRARLRHTAGSIVEYATKLREAHKEDARFELLQGAAHLAVGQEAQAAQWLKAAAKRPGLSQELVQTLVEQFDQLGMSEDAIAVLEQGVAGGGSGELKRALARRLWERAKWDRTAELLADVKGEDAKADATLVAFRAIALANLSKKGEAEALRAGLASRNQAAARAWTILLRRIIDAADIDDKQLVAECKSALALDQQNAYLHYYLGDANARLGEIDLAIESWVRCTMLNTSWNVPDSRLIEALLQRGRTDQAMYVASRLGSRIRNSGARTVAPGTVIAISRAMAAGVDAGATGAADELLGIVGEVQRQMPGEDHTLLIRVGVLAGRGDKAEAIAEANRAIGRTPPASEWLLLNLASVSRRFDLGIGEGSFAVSEKAHGATVGLAYAKAMDQLLSGKGEAGLASFDEVAGRAKEGQGDPVRWKLARAQFMEMSNHPGARDAWVALGDANPGNQAVQHAIANARSARADRDLMDRTIERLKQLTVEKGLTWRLAKARVLENSELRKDQEDGALLLNDIIRENPQLPEPRVLLAKTLLKMNRVDGALENYAAAARLDPTSVAIAMEYGALLQARGDFERARKELERVEAQLRSPEQRRRAAIMLAQMGSESKAIKLLEQQSQGKVDGLLLATIYRNSGQFDKAEEVIGKLLEKPDAVNVQFATSFFAARGKREQAEKAMALLEGMKSDPGIKDMIRGSYRMETGNTDEAIGHYRAATEEAPGNSVAWRLLAASQVAGGKVADALASVDRALGFFPEDARFKTIKANGELLRQAGSEHALRPLAVSVMSEPVGSESSLELLRILVDGRRSSETERLAAQLQQFVERHPDSLPGHLHLIHTYLAMGRPRDATGAAQRAMNAFPKSAEPAKVAYQIAAVAGRWQEAQSAGQAWKQRAAGDALAADVAIARAMVAQKQFASASSQIQPHLSAAFAEPDRLADVVTVWAIAQTNLGNAQTAAERLWPLVGKVAAWRVRWIQVGMEIQDVKAASEWLDRVAGAIPGDSPMERVGLAEAYDRVARRGESRESNLVKRASELLGQVIADPKAPAMAVLAAASHAERSGDFGSAERLYRRALAADPNLWVAQNNLAVLIVRQGGNPAEAVALATAAARVQPYQATVHDTVAQAQSKAGNARAASESIRVSVKLEPDNPLWRVRLADYLLAAGDAQESSKALQAIDERRLDVRSLPPAAQQRLESLRKQIRG